MKKWMVCLSLLLLLTGCGTNQSEIESEVTNKTEAVQAETSESTSDEENETQQVLLGGMEPDAALEYMKTTPNLVIVEVNAPEWKLSTGFTGAMWIPYTEMEQRYDEIPEGVPVILHCGGGIVSVDAYEILKEKRPDIPELSYIAGAPPVSAYNEWLAEQDAPKEKLTVRLNFNRAGTQASNQYAVWIENEDGELIKTLYVSDFTANGGYEVREDSIPTWVSKANPADMDNNSVDAVSGATPQSGMQSYTWDGTDETGNPVEAGQYKIFVEGTLYWTSSVLYSGDFEWGGNPTTIKMIPVYTEETETNRNMINDVSAELSEL